jgi:hypothetical protein
VAFVKLSVYYENVHIVDVLFNQFFTVCRAFSQSCIYFGEHCDLPQVCLERSFCAAGDEPADSISRACAALASYKSTYTAEKGKFHVRDTLEAKQASGACIEGQSHRQTDGHRRAPARGALPASTRFEIRHKHVTCDSLRCFLCRGSDRLSSLPVPHNQRVSSCFEKVS